MPTSRNIAFCSYAQLSGQVYELIKIVEMFYYNAILAASYPDPPTEILSPVERNQNVR